MNPSTTLLLWIMANILRLVESDAGKNNCFDSRHLSEISSRSSRQKRCDGKKNANYSVQNHEYKYVELLR